MMVFLNGEFVQEAEAKVSVFDRSFMYGDALFETMRVHNGKLFQWSQHWVRLEQGAITLGLHVPFTMTEVLAKAAELLRLNQVVTGVLRLHLSRGVGMRGYSPKGADHPFLVLTTHPAPAGNQLNPPSWTLATSSYRLPVGNPLSLPKHANRLLQVLAKQEAQAQGADEALLLNTAGEVVEAASANLFYIQENHICTPPLSSGALAGVTRELVFKLCRELDFDCQERSITPAKLLEAKGVFLTLSTLGIVEISRIDGALLASSSIVSALQAVYREVLLKETAAPQS
ncbi:MAG: ilvE [Verrucomicrobia bacterium]|jgi:aminodeoxychorismate lyase|nr:ilvE [Verrucomicrobiota bacterium]